MDYQKIYNNLINVARSAPHLGYTETHHVIPICMGGKNTVDNLVKLSAKQHFVAHHLLFKIYGTLALANAWYAMCRVGRGQEERAVNASYFVKAKEARSKLLSETMKGVNNHFYGKKHSEESRAKMRQKQLELKLWENFTEEHKAKLLAAQKKPKTTEHRAKIGRKGFVMLQHITTMEIIRVKKDDPHTLSSDWIHPRKLKPEQRYKCNYCNVITTPACLTRWHNSNCKNKGTQNEN